MFEEVLAILKELHQASKFNCSIEGQESTNNKFDIEQKSENTIKMVEMSTQTQEKEMAQSKQEIELPITSINVKKSDDEVHQFIESIETRNHVDDLLQVQQQELQHQTLEVKMVEITYQVQQQPSPQSQSLWHQLQMKSNTIRIKMMNIYKAEAKFNCSSSQ